MNAARIAIDILGFPGRMIALSKTTYADRHPDRIPIFNANLCTSEEKIWHGDLDLAEDESMLIDVARALGRTIWVLFEQDGRFANERHPLLEQAVIRITPQGGVLVGRPLQGRVNRGGDGKLHRVRPPDTG
jgi:hypothetical protein